MDREREKIVRASKSLQQSSPGTRSEKMNPFWVLSSLLLTANAQLYQQKPYMPAPRSYDLQASPAKESNIIKDASNAISDTVTAALSWDPTGILSSEKPTTSSNDLDASSNSKYKRRRKNKRKRRKNKRKNKYHDDYYDDEDDDDYYYDRDDGYSAPDSGYSAPSSGYSAPSSGYGAPSYEAPSSGYGAPSYSAPSYNAPSYGGDGGGNGFIDFLNALAAFLPIALFLASIPPNLITINTNRRKRDFNEDNEVQYDFPFVRRILELGPANVYKSAECQKRIFCEMAIYHNAEPNFVQKAFHNMATTSPDFVSNLIGTSLLFEATRSGNCDVFKCKYQSAEK